MVPKGGIAPPVPRLIRITPKLYANSERPEGRIKILSLPSYINLEVHAIARESHPGMTALTTSVPACGQILSQKANQAANTMSAYHGMKLAKH